MQDLKYLPIKGEWIEKRSGTFPKGGGIKEEMEDITIKVRGINEERKYLPTE